MRGKRESGSWGVRPDAASMSARERFAVRPDAITTLAEGERASNAGVWLFSAMVFVVTFARLVIVVMMCGCLFQQLIRQGIFLFNNG